MKFCNCETIVNTYRLYIHTNCVRGGRYESIAITKAAGLLPDECAVAMEVVVSRDCNGINHHTAKTVISE